MKDCSTIATASITAVVIFMILGTSCTREATGPTKTPATGPHDTPIVVQGGSLWIWSSVNFTVPSSTGNVSDFQYELPANNQYVDTITAYSDQFFQNKVGFIGVSKDAPWTLCANPHDLKIWSPNTSSGADVINFQSAVPKNVLPIFWPMQFGSGNGYFGFGRRHVDPNPLASLNLTTDKNYTCLSGTLTSCFNVGAKPPCSILCGKPPCFIQLNY